MSWRYASIDEAIAGLLCSAGGARAKEAAGEAAVREMLAGALGQFEDPRTGSRDARQHVPLGARMPVTGDCPPAIHHVGYVVEELRTDVERFAAATGAGPFYAMEHIHSTRSPTRARPAVYDHSSAFGAWGPLLVELTQVHDAQPAGLRDALTTPGAGVGHVAWLADDLEAETARLTAAGLRPFHTGRAGPASAVWFDGDPAFGHPVEVLARREEILRFYEMVRAASNAVERGRAAARDDRSAAMTDAAAAADADVDDVLVLGFGVAGASAAIAAHDAGARVLVAEKMGYGGGNCLHSGGFLFDVEGTAAVDHLDALCFGKTPRPVLEAFAGGLHELPPWLGSLGGATAPVDLQAFGGMLPSWPHFPGAGHVTYALFTAEEDERPGPALFRLLRESVEQRGVEVRYETPASELIVVDGAVTGAVVGGTPIQAPSVILAAGGFEYDVQLRDAHLPVPVIPVGHPGNTGDALRLARQAGAAAWHMSAFFGWFAFSHPDHVAGFPLDVHAPSFIYVDADGRRFADETGWEVHDKVRC